MLLCLLLVVIKICHLSGCKGGVGGGTWGKRELVVWEIIGQLVGSMGLSRGKLATAHRGPPPQVRAFVFYDPPIVVMCWIYCIILHIFFSSAG
jgi:hypothetical protein